MADASSSVFWLSELERIVWTIVHQMHSFLSQVRNKNRWGENNQCVEKEKEATFLPSHKYKIIELCTCLWPRSTLVQPWLSLLELFLKKVREINP